MAATATPPAETALDTIEPELRKARFAKLLATKVEQGYDVESQGETDAVIATRGRRRRFHSQVVGKRQRISIDEQGNTTTHGLETPGPE
jgi:mRNA-degrading endonuclease HigB of HigAB toxin-antitoxin module